MSQITDSQRIERIAELLLEVNGSPPERHETHVIKLATGDKICDVILMNADEVILNPRSHRIRSQLYDDQDWESVKGDPTGESAQRIIERYVRQSRTEEQFSDLKRSLQTEGQVDPGVMTYDGVLVNANTRAVAMRELENPDHRYLRLAVLPRTVQPEEIGLLELRLQMQKELKVDYSFTNELLFIEELSNERGMSDSAIASELRFNPESPKKGAAEVGLRLKYLDLLREMQRIPEKPLKLSDFDCLALQQLRGAYATHHALFEKDPVEAKVFLENFLLSVLVGVTSVHQIRNIDSEFVRTYMLPSLEEDDLIGAQAVQVLVSPQEIQIQPEGSQLLAGSDTSIFEGDKVNVVRMINAINGKDHSVKIPGSAFTIEKSDIKVAIRDAVLTGIKDKRRDGREANRLEAPIEAIKSATREILRADEVLRAALSDPDFDTSKKKTLEANFKKLQRSLRTLETALSKAEVIGT